MILYGLGMLPLTVTLKVTVPSALQPWYDINTAVRGNFYEVSKVFSLLQTIGPVRGYFPELTKSILVVKVVMVERAKAHFDIVDSIP